MVICDFDAEGLGLGLGPFKAYPPLLVDADAELSLTVAAQCFKAIARKQHQIFGRGRAFQYVQASFSLGFERFELANPLTRGKALRAFIPISPAR